MADPKTLRLLLLGKIHHAVVTRAEPSGAAGLAVDRALLEAAGFLEHEKVDLYDATNGARLATEVSATPRGTGDVVVGGPAAHLVQPGDLVVLAAYGWVKEKAAKRHAPRLVLVDEKNRVVEVQGKTPPVFDDVTPTSTEALPAPKRAAEPKPAAKPSTAPAKKAKDGERADKKKKDKRR